MADKTLSAALGALQLDSSGQSKPHSAQSKPRRVDHASPDTTKHGQKPERAKNLGKKERPSNDQSLKFARQGKPEQDGPATDKNGILSGVPGESLTRRPRCREGNYLDDAEKTAPSTAPRSIDHQNDIETSERLAQIYVVKRMRPSEEVLGVYCQLQQANDRASEYLHTKHGIAAREITHYRGILDTKDRNAAKGKAIRIFWASGASELLTRGGQPWIRVLVKPWKPTTKSVKPETVYLALDESRGLFVVGVYATKEEAWEGCKKYWTALAICAPLENMTGSVDGHNIPHARARTMGTYHHWFVRQYHAR